MKEDENQHLLNSATAHNDYCILIGPEGDFTEQEYSLAEQSNFSSASLGDNILRVETAAISAFSFVKIIYNGL